MIFDTSKPVAFGGDHAGFRYKELLKDFLLQRGLSIRDFGPDSDSSVDYPDFAHPVAAAVEQGAAVFGVLICGSGNGVAITANKHQGVRAALCWTSEIAALARQHNDANILCIPARFVTEEQAVDILRSFLEAQFEGGRHANRVHKIACQ